MRMVFGKIKPPKWAAKVLAGAGIVTLVGMGISQVAPGFMESTIGKVAMPLLSYSIGGVEAAAGAIITEVAQNSLTSFTGPTAEGNVQVDSL